MKRISEEEWVEIASRYAAGATLLALKTELRISEGRLKRELSSRCGLRANPRPPFSEEEKDAVLRLWKEGETCHSEIARRIGRSQVTVSRVLREHDIPTGRAASGERHGHWKGGRYVTAGVRWVLVATDDPMNVMCVSGKRHVMEHRLVMARALGRPLLSSEQVHHKNGDKLDNRLENLQLRQGNHGSGGAYECADCGSRNVRAVEL